MNLSSPHGDIDIIIWHYPFSYQINNLNIDLDCMNGVPIFMKGSPGNGGPYINGYGVPDIWVPKNGGPHNLLLI